MERAINRAEILGLTDRLSLPELIERYPARHGTRQLRALLASLNPHVTRSELEDRFLTFLGRHGLPRPEVNASLWLGDRWIEVDCLWRSARVIVELDGHATHSTRKSFEDDRARDRALQAQAWRVVRVTWRQLHDQPAAVAVDLASLGLSG